MKTLRFPVMTVLAVSTILFLGFTFRRLGTPSKKTPPFVPPKGCVYRTLMGEESSEENSRYKTPEKVQQAVEHGLS
ncbi:MAG: hypothetical protein OEV24_05090, partial [Cyclobacteriaceae bacterium]|nr:hypothetical protein [Cyclobacteriaceae bacterium]